MSDTHPNAFLQEAAAKRSQIVTLKAEAEDLEAKAKELLKTDSSTTDTEDGTLPEGGRTYTPEPEQTEESKSKLFGKK